MVAVSFEVTFLAPKLMLVAVAAVASCRRDRWSSADHMCVFCFLCKTAAPTSAAGSRVGMSNPARSFNVLLGKWPARILQLMNCRQAHDVAIQWTQ